MTTSNPTSANLRALETTVQAYEQAILDLKAGDIRGVRDRWSDWGYSQVCRLCDSVTKDPEGFENIPDCGRCVLGPYQYGCCDRTRIKLLEELWEWEGMESGDLLRAFRARLRFILQRAARNGIILVERGGRR